MQKTDLITLSKNFVREYLKLTRPEKLRILNLSRFRISPNLHESYRKYSQFCLELETKLPPNIKSLFQDTQTPEMSNKTPQDKTPSTEEAQPSKQQSIGSIDARYLASFLHDFPFEVLSLNPAKASLKLQEFILTAHKKLNVKKLYLIPFSLRSYLVNANVSYQIKDQSLAGFSLKLNNNATNQTKEFIFHITSSSKYDSVLQSLELFIHPIQESSKVAEPNVEDQDQEANLARTSASKVQAKSSPQTAQAPAKAPRPEAKEPVIATGYTLTESPADQAQVSSEPIEEFAYQPLGDTEQMVNPNQVETPGVQEQAPAASSIYSPLSFLSSKIQTPTSTPSAGQDKSEPQGPSAADMAQQLVPFLRRRVPQTPNRGGETRGRKVKQFLANNKRIAIPGASLLIAIYGILST